jgi:hypothetical protein
MSVGLRVSFVVSPLLLHVACMLWTWEASFAEVFLGVHDLVESSQFCSDSGTIFFVFVG